MKDDIDPDMLYVSKMLDFTRSRVKEHGRLPVGSLGVGDDVFLAVESRLRYHLSKGAKPAGAWGALEDSILLSVENHYPISRRNPKFDVDDWFAYVDETVLHGEAEVYLWWHTHGLEKYEVPTKLVHRIEVLKMVVENDMDDSIIAAAFG